MLVEAQTGSRQEEEVVVEVELLLLQFLILKPFEAVWPSLATLLPFPPPAPPPLSRA